MLVSPADRATEVSTNPILSWSFSPGATSYRIQVSANSGSFSPRLDQHGVKGTSLVLNIGLVSGLAPKTTYYWQVQAIYDPGVVSPWSRVGQFTTGIGTPVLVSPADGTTGVPTSPTLSWPLSDGANSYRVQVSNQPLFLTNADLAIMIEELVLDQERVSSNSYTFTPSTLIPNTAYYWRVQPVTDSGPSLWSAVWQFTTLKGTADQSSKAVVETGLPTAYTLSQNFPNPFNPETTISYELPEAADIRLSIYSLTGGVVRTLVLGHKQPGWYEVVWDGRDAEGREVSSGVYFYRLEAVGRGFVETRKMLLMR